MSHDFHDLRPTTVLGLKSKAKKLGRDLAVPYSEALDLAARQSGATSYRHFRRLYGGLGENARYDHEILLEQDWIDEEGNARRVVLHLRLSRPVDDLPCRGIGHLPRVKVRRRMSNSFLIAPWSGQDEASTREDLLHVARTIQFVDATDLVLGLSKCTDDYPRYKSLDHSSAWTNRQSGKSLYIDEQYRNPRGNFIGTFDEQGADWCRQNGFNWAKPAWAGMYRPQDDCEFVLMSHKEWGEPLGPIVSKLENYAPALLGWTGDIHG